MNWLGFLCLFHYAFTIKLPYVIITELFHDIALFACITITFKIVQSRRFILKNEQSTIAFIILIVNYTHPLIEPDLNASNYRYISPSI